LIHFRDDDMKKRTSEIEWRPIRFDKPATAIAKHYSHCVLFVMSGQNVCFAIPVEVGDGRKPWLTRAKRKST
jgi:hypothetical protein